MLGLGRRGRPETIRAIPLRHPWRWVSAVVVFVAAFAVVYTFATAPELQLARRRPVPVLSTDPRGNHRHPRVDGHRDGDRSLARGAARRHAPLREPGGLNRELVLHMVLPRDAGPRADLLLVQHRDHSSCIRLGIPFTHFTGSESPTRSISPFLAAMLGLGLNEAAYMSEIVRAGIISVDHGQTEAAQALGMTRVGVMRRIVLPRRCA